MVLVEVKFYYIIIVNFLKIIIIKIDGSAGMHSFRARHQIY